MLCNSVFDRSFSLSLRRAPCRSCLSRCWSTVPGVSAITAATEGRSGERTSGSWSTEASPQQKPTEPTWEWWDDVACRSTVARSSFWCFEGWHSAVNVFHFGWKWSALCPVPWPISSPSNNWTLIVAVSCYSTAFEGWTFDFWPQAGMLSWAFFSLNILLELHVPLKHDSTRLHLLSSPTTWKSQSSQNLLKFNLVWNCISVAHLESVTKLQLSSPHSCSRPQGSWVCF